MAIPIYEGLKQAHPKSALTVWCSFPELLESNPYVDRILPADGDPGRSRFDHYVLLRGAPRTSVRIEHYANAAGIPAPNSKPKLYWPDWSYDKDKVRPNYFVAISTGASWTTKRWPIERWRELARALLDNGSPVVQIGQKDEAIGVGDSVLDQTSVREAACILRAARLFIGCDSGLMHLALAVGTPVIALFGPTVARILMPNEPNITAITNERPCQGCWNDSSRSVSEGICPLNIPCCMDTIAVDRVLTSVKTRLLGER